MDAVEFLKEKNRMMLSDLKSYNKLQKIPTNDGIVKFVFEWSKNHTVKTRLQDFLEKYPNVKTINGYPILSPRVIGYCNDCEKCHLQDFGDYYSKCWNEPVE